MITPNKLAEKASAIPVAMTKYSFLKQTRNGKASSKTRAYSYGSLQTYDWNGRPYDSRGDNWD